MTRARIIAVFAAVSCLAGCGRHGADGGAPVATPSAAPVSAALVDRLAGDRTALDAALSQCKAKTAEATPSLCAAAAEAERRRFKAGSSVYRPQSVQLFRSTPGLPPDRKPAAGR
jgi:hypothetical protein